MRRSSLRWTLPLFLGLQVALLWIQGAQIHRQTQVLQNLREDIQVLANAIEANRLPENFEEDGQVVPSSFRARRPQSAPKETRVAVLGAEEEQDASKELQASRESARKAVTEAKETRSKLSLEENAKKVEEAKQVQAVTQSGKPWVWGAVGLLVIALVVRAYLRRRG